MAGVDSSVWKCWYKSRAAVRRQRTLALCGAAAQTRRQDLGELGGPLPLCGRVVSAERIGKKRVRVPVLVTLGVCADDQRVVLDLWLPGWRGILLERG
jgi:hypothetical protein